MMKTWCAIATLPLLQCTLAGAVTPTYPGHTCLQAAIHARYKDELQAQIAANEERRKLDRQMYLEEGRRMRELAELEKMKLQVGHV